jgi:F-type H+-transporting ATPase subunit delta
MADASTFARPYARAAFDYANEHKAVGEWRRFLDRLAELATLAPVHDLVSTPAVSRERRAEVLAEIADVAVPRGGDNFLRLMARNGRLEALPAVAEEFARLEALAEATVEAVIETAVELEPAAADRLVAALSKRLGRKLEASFRVAPDIIGGVIVRLGDQVIDASLATRLTRLARAMAA